MAMVLNCKCELCGAQFGIDVSGTPYEKVQDSLFTGNNPKIYALTKDLPVIFDACDDHTAVFAKPISMELVPKVDNANTD